MKFKVALSNKHAGTANLPFAPHSSRSISATAGVSRLSKCTWNGGSASAHVCLSFAHLPLPMLAD
eukprot:1160580-Pelagomonas_calceolata.AAC.14